jgi:GNAT superfamily N-acetyltransferase
VAALSRRVYGAAGAWLTRELRSHQGTFPEGQLAAVDRETDRIVGFAVSLVIRAEAFPLDASWRQVTADGHFTTHDPEAGDTLYGAGVAVDPEARGRGVGRRLYRAREALVHRLGLSRIRAGARIPGYGAVADRLTAEEYVRQVEAGIRRDPTLSFQLRMGFRVLGVVPDYLPEDGESRGYAAVVEWTG